MNTTFHHEAAALVQPGPRVQPGLITATQLLALPEPMQRYLRYAGVVGHAPIRTVRLLQQGVMRTQPGKKWLSALAQQDVSMTPPAFRWHATIQPLPLVPISVTDRFAEGHGTMSIKLLSLLTLGNARGPEMDQGELQRYLAEMVWYPTAWLADTIGWEIIDAYSIRATMRMWGLMAAVVLHVNEQGQMTHVTADRYKEEHGHYLLAPWSGACTAYQEVDGMYIPTKIEITWHLASGDFTWFRMRVTEIEYNQSGKVTRT